MLIKFLVFYRSLIPKLSASFINDRCLLIPDVATDAIHATADTTVDATADITVDGDVDVNGDTKRW